MLPTFLFVFVMWVSNFCNSLEKRPEILMQKFTMYNDNSYYYRYVTSDGIERYENGGLVPVDGNLILRVAGGFRYTGDDGKVYSVSYTSGEKGYIVQNPVEQKEESSCDDLFDDDRIVGSNLINSLTGGNFGR